MSNYDDFKKKAKETLDTFADVSVEAYKIAEEKARILAKRTKLRAVIVNEKATIRRLSVELGTTYYKMYKDSPAPEFEKICVEITGAHERIEIKEKEIEELKKMSIQKTQEAKPPKQEKSCNDDDKPDE